MSKSSTSTLFPPCADADPCPCGRAEGGRSGRAPRPKNYADCCQPFHRGGLPPDAESLMRSRYSAYVLGLVAYLLNTWHPDTRPAELALDPAQRWLGLTVTDHRSTGPDQASVVFIARYRWNGRGHRLQESSRFVRQADRWWYVDGSA